MSHVAPGDVLAGKYCVTKVLGVGGMGVVVAATHLQLDELVALKFMLPEALGNSVAIQRFLREARAAVKLRSEHVARVSDVGTLETGAPYIVMEYLDGTDLSNLLAAQGTIAIDVAVEYVLQACDAIAEAHSMGVIHRDLKPANLFLTHRKDGTPLLKVLDFGISKSSMLSEKNSGTLTKGGGIIGSPVYMSPEQMRSAKDVDGRTDIWALGIILYELLGGRPPFDGETIGELMALVLTEPPPPLTNLRVLPPVLAGVVEKCLEKDRDLRWRDVAQLAKALAPFAPARAQPLVERISIVVAQTAPAVMPYFSSNPTLDSPATLRDGIASRPAVSVPGAVASAATVAASATAAGWGSTANPVPSTPRKRVLVAAAVALGVFVVVRVLAVRFLGSSEPAPAVTVASTAPSASPAADPVPAIVATAVPPPTATAPGTGAPAPSASAAPPTVTRAPAAATPRPKGPRPGATTPSKPRTGLLDTSN